MSTARRLGCSVDGGGFALLRGSIDGGGFALLSGSADGDGWLRRSLCTIECVEALDTSAFLWWASAANPRAAGSALSRAVIFRGGRDARYSLGLPTGAVPWVSEARSMAAKWVPLSDSVARLMVDG